MFKRFLDEIAAVTEEEVEATHFHDTPVGGEVVGEPITDPFLRKLVSLFFREMQDSFHSEATIPNQSPESELVGRLKWLRFMVLSSLLDFTLHKHYGQYVSPDEWTEELVELVVAPGWRVLKVRFDDQQSADELQHLLDESDKLHSGRNKRRLYH